VVRALLDARLQAVDLRPYAELERAAFG